MQKKVSINGNNSASEKTKRRIYKSESSSGTPRKSNISPGLCIVGEDFLRLLALDTNSTNFSLFLYGSASHMESRVDAGLEYSLRTRSFYICWRVS